MCTANNNRNYKNSKKNSKSSLLLLPQDYTPGANDILCGRGNVFSNHQGNQFFGRIIRANLREYMGASNRPEKIKVVDDILREIQVSGARFAKVDSETKGWYELNDVQAHQKIGHAIRDTIRLLEKDNKKNSSAKATRATVKIMKKSSVAKQKMLLQQKRQARCMMRSQQQLQSPNHIRSSSETRKDAMEDILRISLNTCDFLDGILGDSVERETVTGYSSERQYSDYKNNENTTRSFLLENEYPETNFDFSATSFFGDNYDAYPNQIIYQ